jgi:DNA-binding MarR family transcriptional regulator
MKALNNAPMKLGEPPDRRADDLLELLYFVYDKGISAISATMRGQLTQTQAAIIWLVHSEGDSARSMPRKEIARRLHDWFDLGNPAITSALQSLAQPPVKLVRLLESADSGREKRVFLTTKGVRFAAAMAIRGQHLVQQLIADLGAALSDDQITAGIEFLRLSVSFFGRINAGTRLTNPSNGNSEHYPRDWAPTSPRFAPNGSNDTRRS